MNVIQFKPRPEKEPPLVWLCNCGGTDFNLYSDGSARCVSCQVEAIEHYGWYQQRLTKHPRPQSGHTLSVTLPPSIQRINTYPMSKDIMKIGFFPALGGMILVVLAMILGMKVVGG